MLLYESVYESVFIHLNFQSFLILDFLLDLSGNNIHPFLLVENSSLDSCYTACCVFSGQIAWQVSQVYGHTNVLFEYMNFLKKNHRVFRNLNLRNLENVLKWNLRTDRSKESIFRVPGGKIFLIFSAWHQLVLLSWI